MEAEEPILTTSGTQRWEWKTRTLENSMGLVLDYLEATRYAVFRATSKSNLWLNGFAVTELYCCDNLEDERNRGIPQGMSVRETCARCMSTLEDIKRQRRMRVRTMAVPCWQIARGEVLNSSLALLVTNITVEKRRIKKRLWREALREMSSSELPSFTEGLQICQEALLASVYSIFRLEPLYNVNLSISTLFKQNTFTHLGSDDICSHLKELVHKRRLLSKMCTTILLDVNSIPAEMRWHSSLPKLQVPFSHGESSL